MLHVPLSELASELWFLFMEMHYLNIFVANLRAQEYVSSHPVARATWLNLLAYCVEQENGGTIENCGNWTDRQWLTYCGVTKEEAETASPLVEIKDGNAKVWAYPDSQEAKAQKNRASGSRGGLAKKANALASATQNAVANASECSSECYENASTKDNERKEKENEMVMEGAADEKSTAPDLATFCEYFSARIACLGFPVSVDDWLMETHGYYASQVWPQKPPQNWKAMEGKLIANYRNRHAQLKMSTMPMRNGKPQRPINDF